MLKMVKFHIYMCIMVVISVLNSSTSISHQLQTDLHPAAHRNFAALRDESGLERRASNKKGDKQGNRSDQPVFCQGYMDQNGIWNNGFYCPRFSEVDTDHCCGSQFQRKCCSEPTTTEGLSTKITVAPTNIPEESFWSLPMLISIATGSVVALVVLILIFCFICSCCPGRKWVKGTSSARTNSAPIEQPLYNHNGLRGASTYDRLACGCPLNGPKTCGGCQGSALTDSSDIPKDVDRRIRITKNPQVAWFNYYDETPQASTALLKSGDEPPPYCALSDTSSVGKSSDYTRLQAESSSGHISDYRSRLSSPSESRMETFKPPSSPVQHQANPIPPSPLDALLTPYLSPLENYRLHPRDIRRHELDTSRRDSGVLEEDTNNSGDGDEHEDFNGVITVGQFNFRSPEIIKSLKSPIGMSESQSGLSSNASTLSMQSVVRQATWERKALAKINEKRTPPRNSVGGTIDGHELAELHQLLDSVNGNHYQNSQMA